MTMSRSAFSGVMFFTAFCAALPGLAQKIPSGAAIDAEVGRGS